MLYSLLEHLAVIFLEGKFAKEHWFHMCSCIFQNIDCSNKTLIHENPLVNKFYIYNLWKLSTLTLALSWGWRDDSVVKNTGCSSYGPHVTYNYSSKISNILFRLQVLHTHGAQTYRYEKDSYTQTLNKKITKIIKNQILISSWKKSHLLYNRASWTTVVIEPHGPLLS
jgi:hypothetical protein